MTVNYPATLVRTGRASAVGAATEITLEVGARVKISRVKILRVSGTAATLTPRIVSTTGAAAGSFDEEWSKVATPVGTKIDDANLGILCQSTANKLYLILAPDAGSDNVVDYAVYFELCSPGVQ